MQNSSNLSTERLTPKERRERIQAARELMKALGQKPGYFPLTTHYASTAFIPSPENEQGPAKAKSAIASAQEKSTPRRARKKVKAKPSSQEGL